MRDVELGQPYLPDVKPSWSSGSCGILYVEDDATVRRLSANVLLSCGYRVDVAEDGEEGWDALRLGHYDLLITDNQMPRLTGLELVRRLRTAGHTLPVVLASGSFNEEEARREQWLELAATLKKPFTTDQLLATVREVLGAAGSTRKEGRIFLPVLAEVLAHVEPAQHWGINE